MKKSGQYPLDILLSAKTRQYVLQVQHTLLQHALAPWPRRSAPLLVVNCGDGAFLPFLWQSGFEVQATESEAALRAQARSRNIWGLPISAADDTDLPYDDDAFDWVIMHLKISGDDILEANAKECLRLAKRGFMLTFWNVSSIPGICWRITHKGAPWMDAPLRWRQVIRHIRKLDAGRISTLSVLAGPVCTWRKIPYFSFINSMCLSLPFGAWCIIRVELEPSCPLTPLSLGLGAPLVSPQPAMEYAHKSPLSSQKIVGCKNGNNQDSKRQGCQS